MVRAGETLTHFPRQKAARILSYLALHSRQPHPRERLVDLFWPDLDLPAGRDNLSTTLTALRRLLEPGGMPRGGILIATHQHVGLNRAVVTTDAAEFERLLGTAGHEKDPALRAEGLAEAVALYRGEALSGIYDDWATLESERLQCLFVDALRDLTSALEELGKEEEARRAAIRWAAADPYAEEAHLRLIALHARTGHSGDAHAAAQRLAHLWQEEFGSALSSACQAEIAAALALPVSALEVRHSQTLSSSALPGNGSTVPANPSPLPIPLVPLPIPLDCFFGRETELAWLAEAFESGSSRLVTLVSPGGMGKTRLALDFAARAAGRFACYFVSLAETQDPDQLLPAIVRALALPPGDADPLTKIASSLQADTHSEKPRTLLILDNLEQLISLDVSPATSGQDGESARIIQSLLLNVPELSCLCTSRLSLNLRGERLIPVSPLALPPEIEDAQTKNQRKYNWENLASFASVQLYVDRAKAVRPDFSVTPENAPAIASVCRMLDGSPLALELAASWVRLLPPRAMWERLARQTGMTALETRRSDAPARHHSLRAALDWSWRLLRPAEQCFLRHLSIFRGGWTLEAAEEVCAEPNSLSLLSHLMEASLLRVTEGKDGETRYGLLETVRQYAREQVEESNDEQTCRARHVAYYFALVQKAQLEGHEQARWLDILESDHDNLRAALDCCRDTPEQAERGLWLAEALLPFWRARGYLKEGEERTLSLLIQPPAARTDARAAALNTAGCLAMLQSDYDRSTAYHQEAHQIAREHSNKAAEADALHGLGNLAFFSQDYPAASGFLQRSLELRQQESERSKSEKGLAASWHSLGSLALRNGQHQKAHLCYERALGFRRRRGDEIGSAMTLGGLGQVARLREDYIAAARYAKEALKMFDATNQRWTASLCLNDLSLIAHERGQRKHEVRLVAASLAIREQFNFRTPPVERVAEAERFAEMRAQMGESTFEAIWAEGQALSWEEAIASALSVPGEEAAPFK
ncbi:MAG: tetratricopeptide repeat protein [Janthinobacterium lividum]